MNDRALKVLEQYEIEVLGMRRARGAYILETPQGLRSFCDYDGSEKRARFQNCVTKRIREGGYENVDVFVENKEGNLVSVDREGQTYVVREWYYGRECDLGNETEVLAAVRNLACLHRLMTGKEEPSYRSSFTAPGLEEEMEARNRELRKVRAYLRKKNEKTEFERGLLSSFNGYYERAEEALRKLKENPMCQLREQTEQRGCICHGDYDQHHILMSGREIATTGFEHCRYDVQVNDLCRFLRKTMEKHEWEERLGMRMIDQYTVVRNLSGEERRFLYLRLLYPEKFRKLAGFYLGSRKSWISRKYQEKLNLLNEQQKNYNKFVKMLE